MEPAGNRHQGDGWRGGRMKRRRRSYGHVPSGGEKEGALEKRQLAGCRAGRGGGWGEEKRGLYHSILETLLHRRPYVRRRTLRPRREKYGEKAPCVHRRRRSLQAAHGVTVFRDTPTEPTSPRRVMVRRIRFRFTFPPYLLIPSLQQKLGFCKRGIGGDELGLASLL
ncbi:hypothetical protein HPP92_028246 [Vanilla planifolia]|uniref:Uncharacterized protein n=1 Tax=Vanilla planifolia TaxID=51239 RepID=A0A835P8J4_VANPL|nr:hypothetical protein HPP92_028246 [Vanilla planifolia]